MGLFDRGGLPSDEHRTLAEALGGRQRVLAWARSSDGPVVGLPGRLALRSADGWRTIGWHEIGTGGWDAESGRLRWTLTDGTTDEVLLAEPGALPELFRERVDASIAVQQRVELGRGRAALIVARRRLDDDGAPLAWSVSRQGGAWDAANEATAAAELLRLQREYDVTGQLW